MPLVIAAVLVLLWAMALLIDRVRLEHWGVPFGDAMSEIESAMGASFPEPLVNGKAARCRYVDLRGFIFRFESDISPRQFVEKTFGGRVEQARWPRNYADRMFPVLHTNFQRWWKSPPITACVFYGRLQGQNCHMTLAGFAEAGGKLTLYGTALTPLARRFGEPQPSFVVAFYQDSR
jgi:hypothetical protein